MKRKILVTSALPYANGPIHFGHIAGAYLPADIFVRFMRMSGHEVIYICGSDDHGVPITITAEARGITPAQHVAENYALIKSIFERMNVEFSNFSQTSRKDPHYAVTQEFFSRLSELGHIEKRTEEQFYCESCKRFLSDRYITGKCPFCAFDGARGDECGGCGKSIEPKQLINPLCKISGHTPVLRPTTHWYIRLSDFADWLGGWLDSKPDWRQLVLNEARKYLDEGLHTRAITRDISWGIPMPGDDPEFEGKVIYVWFDAPIGYISSTIEYFRSIGAPERWKEFWKPENPADVSLYNFIGKDNIFFHAVMFPIMCHGLQQGYKLTDNVVSNAFLTLEGRQFSKSEGWYIDPLDFLERYPADSARFYLCSIMPENSDSEFRWDDFGARHNELANVYGNIVHRVISFAQSNFGEIPAYTGNIADNPSDVALLDDIRRSLDATATAIGEFSFRRALESMMEIARAGHKYIDTSEPWKVLKEDRARAGSILNICLRLVKALAVASRPFLPESSAKIYKMLAMPGCIGDASWDSALADDMPVGAKLEKPEILFTRIEKTQVEEEKKKLSGFDKKQKDAKMKKVEAVRPERTFDDFQKIDLRAARIIEAEPVPKSNKLIRLTVDIGVEQRQVVAGIAAHYKPEELIGRMVIIIANLEPRALMGFESRGMVLAANDGESLRLLSPDGDIAPGTRIS